jgi:hypothetical protein
MKSWLKSGESFELTSASRRDPSDYEGSWITLLFDWVAKLSVFRINEPRASFTTSSTRGWDAVARTIRIRRHFQVGLLLTYFLGADSQRWSRRDRLISLPVLFS